MPREYLGNIDAALLHVDDPTNLLMITGVMVFKAPVDFERLKATIEDRLLSIRRFRQRVAWPALGRDRPYWVDDPDFDLKYHVQRLVLPPPGGQAALQEVVSLLASTPLSLSRPLWQFHLVQNYAECCALVVRFHHALGDGVALVHVILSLTDSDADAPWPVSQPENPHRRGGHRSGRSGFRAGWQVAGNVVSEGFDMLSHPSRFADLGRAGRDALRVVGNLALSPPDPQTVLRGELGVKKRAAWSEGIPLGEIKTIRRGLGGTVNDVLLAALTGALRRYMQDRGDPVDDISIRVAVPVNLRPAGGERQLGNRMGAVFLTLPVYIADPAYRLHEIHYRMKGSKSSVEAPTISVLLHALGKTPARLTKTLVETFGTRATAVMTNVKGPQERLYLAGAPLEALLPWAPTTGRMGVAVGILSYAGQVRVGVLTDEGLVPDPEEIVKGFQLECEALLTRAREALQRPSVDADTPSRSVGAKGLP